MQRFDESIVRGLWCEILGVESLTDDASFLELGGASIAAEQLADRISHALGVDLSGLDILSEPSYATFLERLRMHTD